MWRLQSDTKARRNPSEISKEDFVAGMSKLGYDNTFKYVMWHIESFETIIIDCLFVIVQM